MNLPLALLALFGMLRSSLDWIPPITRGLLGRFVKSPCPCLDPWGQTVLIPTVPTPTLRLAVRGLVYRTVSIQNTVNSEQ